MADTDYTVVFHGHPRNIEGNPFNVESPFGKVTIISVGNAVADADRFREALEAIAEGEIGKSADIAQAALDEGDAAMLAALEAGKSK